MHHQPHDEGQANQLTRLHQEPAALATARGVAFLLALNLTVTTLPGASAAADLRFGGSLSTHLQVGVSDCPGGAGSCKLKNFRNLNVLGFDIEARPHERVDLNIGLDLRNLNFSEIETFDDLGRAERVQPISFRVREASVTLVGFLLDDLDLKVGAQRIAWGTADGFNPTDRLNPYDLEDPTRFDKRLSSVALLLSYHAGPVTFEGALLPLFSPAAMPVESFDVTSLQGDADPFDLEEYSTGEPPEVRRIELPLEAPEATLDGVSGGARVVWKSPAGHLGLSWYRGRDSLPQGDGKARLSGFQTMHRVDVSVPLVFPEISVYGLEYRGHVHGSLSVWVEAALVQPERTALSADPVQLGQLVKLGNIDRMPDPVPVSVTQKDDPFVNAVAGLDFDIPGGPYVNLQYLHGLALERSAGDQHHYAFAAVVWPFLQGRLRLSARGAMELADLDPSGKGWLGGGELSWLHADTVELRLGAVLLGGEERSTLSHFEDLGHAYLAFAVSY